ncbi:ribose-phosphate diphosphokinase [Bacillus mycoides]|jgi:ribose-phosphate pyrophosphokinase|uniref:Ribose-phosphate pyrophosphokinase n=14 Tax=Bacillus cereus group TaxID=86661 RepID=A0A150C1A2_BACCE|nr:MULTISPECIES: ribose-phosphate diphosphokinase [Bacillus]EJQ43475.1 ribose-phosphate pyrophosphokinase [Bacillus cereus BAG6X1-2]EJQ62865.1 ribose-phosphate pyrophosphokinase [Bacillus cereus HuA2-4]EJR99545.1 ribose-phosphate pyrophosphokinase [Bacillus cereus VDM034]EJS16729.1 ribose-phosphate pyrophosphokinase [Bacillus cereus VDM062]MBK5360125.1 ribose-phosphate diphosphokinase [Bacillus sp. TH44]MBK5514781.1 ribose-phosphate diphosphokinase [Bacillus sp. TH11]MBT2580831.1 ribose-phos
MSTQYLNSNLKVFSLNSNKELAEQIAKHIGVGLGKCSVDRFSDGEVQINIEESIRGCDVFIIQSTSFPVNEHIMELLIMIDALKRASAKTINIVIPYYGYARQDRKARSREPITSKLVANLLETAGATRVITLDLHAPQIQGFFDIPIDHLMGVPILSDYFEAKGLKDIVIVSPDHGGVTRARKMADRLKAPIAIIDKRRPRPNVSEVMNIIGNIEGKTAILIDDIIDTAGTITLAANALVENGASEVYACCTHPVLSGPAIERIQNSNIKELVVTNSIVLPEEKKIDKVHELSVAPLIGEAIIRVYEEESVSVLFN